MKILYSDYLKYLASKEGQLYKDVGLDLEKRKKYSIYDNF